MSTTITGLPAMKKAKDRKPESMILLCYCVERMNHSLYSGREITQEAVEANYKLIQRVDGLKEAMEARMKAQGIKTEAAE